MSRSLTIDNGTQFNNLKAESFCDMYGIKVNYSLVYHPQENRMVETTNMIIVGNIWRNLEDMKGGWLIELLKVLWARTTKKRATDESQFALVFRTEVVLPTEAVLPTLLLKTEENQRQLVRNLDLLEEVRECA